MPAGLDYPLPSHAAYLWLGEMPNGGEALFVAFPPAAEGSKGHTVHFPTTPQGFEALTTFLRSRAREAKREGTLRSRLGTPCVPTQAMVDALSRFQTKIRPGHSALPPANEITLEDLGI